MIKIGAIKVLVSNCITGVYLRWWFNGWHYYNFTNGYEISMKTESLDTQVTNYFSVISKIERPTKLKAEFDYKITVEGIRPADVSGFLGLLMAEKVEQYEGAIWREVNITRGDHLVREEGGPGYILNFEITRDELPLRSSVMKKYMKLYVDDVLCDLDDDEPIPINKQVNDIAEMQNRQSDFTAQFKIRKTRLMRGLFELSGEVGINTNYPYENKLCKLIQDGIELITDGKIILDKVDDQYYYVAIYSGNLNLFSSIDNLKINDLVLIGTHHQWIANVQAASNSANLDYIYPLLEPSDDGGLIVNNTDPGNDRCELYGGWIFPFIKVKAIWDKIFADAGYTVEGNINTDAKFEKLFMPIVNRNIPNINIADLCWSVERVGYVGSTSPLWNTPHYWRGNRVPLVGDAIFQNAEYTCAVVGTYRVEWYSESYDYYSANAVLAVGYPIPVFYTMPYTVEMKGSGPTFRVYYSFVYDIACVVGDMLRIYVYSEAHTYYTRMSIQNISDVRIGYTSTITPEINLPTITQTEFIKMICNMYGLIPSVNSKDKKILFWNYQLLYDNFTIARDWSNYLSERDDEVEFKFGEYARSNYLRYTESDDVDIDKGLGLINLEDETLPAEKEVVKFPVSTTDEVIVLDDVRVSRINMTKFNADTISYDEQKTIDARIVYIDVEQISVSPPYEKIFGIRTLVVGGVSFDTLNPKIAMSSEISCNILKNNYSALKFMLTKTNLRRAKFNLPVYEVAGLKHYIPIYLRQYKAYFYVNKINNYVPGRLCTIDLIKL